MGNTGSQLDAVLFCKIQAVQKHGTVAVKFFVLAHQFSVFSLCPAFSGLKVKNIILVFFFLAKNETTSICVSFAIRAQNKEYIPIACNFVWTLHRRLPTCLYDHTISSENIWIIIDASFILTLV